MIRLARERGRSIIPTGPSRAANAVSVKKTMILIRANPEEQRLSLRQMLRYTQQ
jgi:hypothetical protein